MRNYLDWIDTSKFWVRETWDSEKEEMAGEGNLILFPTQRRVLGHALTFDERGRLPYETVLYSCIKKCLAPETKVLTFDLRWVDVGTLHIGDALLGFDEMPHRNGQVEGTGRKYRKSIVTGTGRDVRKSRKLWLSNGKTITASDEHKWLTHIRGGENLHWIETRKLHVGDELNLYLPVWGIEDGYDEGHKAGILDGIDQISCMDKVTITAIEEIDAEVATLSTSTETFFAEGLASHNSGKTAIAASVGAWYAEESRPGTEIYVIANTQEQAEGRVMRDIKFHFEKRNSFLPHRLRCKITQFRIDFQNGTFIQVLAQSFKSVAGSRHALTLWDELWGAVNELDRRTWDEMVPIPTITNSLRFVATYAGFENESELLWELYLKSVGKEETDKGMGTPVPELEDIQTDEHPSCWKNGRVFAYWDHEPRMPWQTDEYYKQQLQNERPSAYLRFHLNRWVTSQEEFIPIEWWDEAAKTYLADAEMWKEHPFRFWPITIGIDAGQKVDSTAIVAVGFDGSRAKVGVVYHKIWTPSKGDPIDLEQTVEKELIKLYNTFNVRRIVYDRTHLIQMMMKLARKGFPVEEFEQTGTNMILASQTLYDLLKNRNLEAYPNDELRNHIQMAVAENTSRGFRIVKGKVSKRHRIDGAVALAMASYSAIKNGGGEISDPIRIHNPFLEEYSPTYKYEEIPFELRSDEDEY